MKKILIFTTFLLLFLNPIIGQDPNKSMSHHNLSISTGNFLVDGYITDAAERYDLDPLLLIAQMDQESKFKLRATSHKGARGLMQLMPQTAKRFGASNPFNAKQNIFAGARYMRWLLDKFEGNLELALAGYNAGEGAVMKFGNQVPPYRETRNYVSKIMAQYSKLRLEQKQLASS